MFKKLFGNNIEPRCIYCHNCTVMLDGSYICNAKSELINGKCRRFKYNPLLRKPSDMPKLPKFDPKDFEL